MSDITQVLRCRICGNSTLETVLDLGVQALTGVFPREPDAPITRGPLCLVRCTGTEGVCGLVQLSHHYSLEEMYGERYGYRSGLNQAMVRHLSDKVGWLLARRPLSAGDVVLDIGSNDGTTLSNYPVSVRAIGIDPTTERFRRFLPPRVEAVADFFSRGVFEAVAGGRKARIVTSIAMFYDLPEPEVFVRDVAAILADDGIWHLEQSYLPTMLETCGYDTVCQEHAEYYGLRQIRWLVSRAGLRITDVQFNDVNGGSFAITLEKGEGDAAGVEALVAREQQLTSPQVWADFRQRIEAQRGELVSTLARLKREGKRVQGLGASTKGNVLLQYCGIDSSLLPSIADVNPDKFGCFTPATGIPICSEREALADPPDVFLVLPWHFRKGFIDKLSGFLAGGGRLLFPLPRVELVGA